MNSISAQIPCGSEPARDGGGSACIDVPDIRYREQARLHRFYVPSPDSWSDHASAQGLDSAWSTAAISLPKSFGVALCMTPNR